MQQCSLFDEFITSCYHNIHLNVNVTLYFSNFIYAGRIFFLVLENLEVLIIVTLSGKIMYFFFLFSYMLYLYMQEVVISHLPVCNFPIICYDDLFVLSFSISSKVVEYCVNIYNMSLCCQGHW